MRSALAAKDRHLANTLGAAFPVPPLQSTKSPVGEAVLTLYARRAPLLQKPRNDAINDRSKPLHEVAPSVAEKSATGAATVYSPKDGNAFRNPQHTRDLVRARIAAALRMVIHDRIVTREDICKHCQIDRRTLDNWMGGYCDPMSWRIAVLGQILGSWFWMHVFGGEIGLAMYRRLKDRIEAARLDDDLAAAVDEVERAGGGR